MRQIPGFPAYSIDDKGRVWSHQRTPSRLLVGKAEDRYGYRRVELGGVRKTLHSLVALTYHGPRPSPDHQVRHLNGNKKDNRPENLAWGTRAENTTDNIRLGVNCGAAHPRAKLVESEILIIRDLHATGTSGNALARMFRVSPRTIRDIVKNRLWKHVLGSVSEAAS